MNIRHIILAAVAASTLASAAPARAAMGDFCRGFEAGWKAPFNDRSIVVPVSPVCPSAPAFKDTFSAGYETGLVAALKVISNRSSTGTNPNRNPYTGIPRLSD